ALEGACRALPDRGGKQGVSKGKQALEEASNPIRCAEPEDRVEAILQGVDADPAEEGRPKVAEAERPPSRRGARDRSAEGQVEDGGEQNREERGQRGGEGARDEQENDGRPVRRHGRSEGHE